MKEGYLFIQDMIQGGKIKPKKYRHYIKIPTYLYDELIDKGVFVPEDYYVNEAAFFEFTDYFVTISFITYWHVEDTHIKILDYLVRKANGGNSFVVRGGIAF